MKFLKILGTSLIVIIALFLIIAIFLPSKYSVDSSIIVNRPIEQVYKYSVDLRNWPQWSIWIRDDKEAEITFEGSGMDVGSTMYWVGKKMGAGSLIMKKTIVNSSYTVKVDIVEPWKLTSLTTFTFEPIKANTKVTWTDKGVLSYPMERWVGLFFDKAMKNKFQKGLINLKKKIESLGSTSETIINVEEIPEQVFYAIPDSSVTMTDLSTKFASAYGELGEFIQKNKIEMVGAPIAYNKIYEPPRYVFYSAFPVKSNKIKPAGRIIRFSIPATKVAKAIQIGPYEKANETYTLLMQFIGKNNYEIAGTSWEAYLNSPADVPQEKLETHIFYPIKIKK